MYTSESKVSKELKNGIESLIGHYMYQNIQILFLSLKSYLVWQYFAAI